jgi:cytidine deaminase
MPTIATPQEVPMPTELESLVRAAKAAREFAYAPYSGFKVGAAVLAKDGRVFGGCNVENASYGLCNCAERTALFTGVAAGCRPGDFTHLAVVADTAAPVPPCGACRQVMHEMGGPSLIVVQSKLLPGAFSLDPQGS